MKLLFRGKKKPIFGLLVLAFILVLPAYAQTASTTKDPQISLDHLDLLLNPLTKDDLAIEAEAWRDRLKQKVSEISQEEIATRNKNKEISKINDAIDEAEVTISDGQKEAAKELIQQEKDETLQTLATLREERTAILDRFEMVIDDYEAKGGDVEDYRKYASAVAGIKVEVTDTSATWMAIKSWVTSKEGGIKWGMNALKFVVIMIIFYLAAKVVGGVIRKTTENNDKVSGLLKNFLNIFVQRAVIFIGLLVAFSTLGVEVGALLAVVGGGAFIIGFALQDTLGNFAAGIMLLIYRPFDVGDVVEIGGVAGVVANVSLVSSTIRSFDNKIILVPNKQVWGQVITNATATDQRRVDLTFGIGYGDDIDKAQSIIQKVVSEHELVLKDPAPTIELSALGESSVDFICRPWTRTADYWRVYWDITKTIKKTFDAEGISIPFPQRDIHVHQVAAKQDHDNDSQTKGTLPPPTHNKQNPNQLDSPEEHIEEPEPNA